MKILKKIVISSLLFASVLSAAAQSAGTTPYNWYVKRGADGSAPSCPPEMDFIKDHDCYYIDTAASDSGDKVIYLTFDAGYENGNVKKILDVLGKERVPGAFFILENLAKREGELVKRMVGEGHTVCNHTARHKDMTKSTDEEFEAELRRMEDAYREAVGEEISKFYRPPEGRFSESNLAECEKLGYTTVLWSFAYADWDNDAQPDPDAAYKKIMKATHPGAIILLHPTSSTNAAILGKLIDGWRAAGYRFGKLSELRSADETA